MKPNTEDRRLATEDRLRAALTARAALVTHRDLHHGTPPQERGWGAHRVRLAALTLGMAAAVVAVCLLVLLPGSPLHPTPTRPAGPPGVSAPPAATRTPPTSPSATPPRVISRP